MLEIFLFFFLFPHEFAAPVLSLLCLFIIADYYMLSWVFLQASVTDGEITRNLSRVMVGGMFLR